MLQCQDTTKEVQNAGEAIWVKRSKERIGGGVGGDEVMSRGPRHTVPLYCGSTW